MFEYLQDISKYDLVPCLLHRDDVVEETETYVVKLYVNKDEENWGDIEEEENRGYTKVARTEREVCQRKVILVGYEK